MLTTFDKINLAHCASRRAQAAFTYNSRLSFEERQEAFSKEFGAARLWINHRMTYHRSDSGLMMHYTQR